jgi:hypothetical protein
MAVGIFLTSCEDGDCEDLKSIRRGRQRPHGMAWKRDFESNFADGATSGKIYLGKCSTLRRLL